MKRYLNPFASQLRQPHGEHAVQVGEKMNEGNRLINIYTIEALALKAEDNILEIGMSNGFFVKDILSVDDTVKYAGCDFSEIMIKQSLKNNQEFIDKGRANFYLANAENLPFADGIFDTVFSVNTLYFWDNPELVLSETKRVLKPAGSLFISIRPKSVMQHYPFAKYGFTMYTKDELIQLLSQHGLKVTESWEREEPDQDVNGKSVVVESLIVQGEKI